jgi:hypothetical protein
MDIPTTSNQNFEGINPMMFTVDAVNEKTAEAEENEMRKKAEKSAKRREINKEYSIEPPKQDPAIGQIEKEKIKRAFKLEEKLSKEDEERQIRTNLFTIQQWREKFPEAAKKVPSLSSNPSLKQTEVWIESIREVRRLGAAGRTVKSFFGNFLFAFEFAWGNGKNLPDWIPERMKFDSTRLTENFNSGNFPQMDEIIDEVSIEYPWLGSAPLIVRILGKMQEMLVLNDMANRNPLAGKMLGLVQGDMGKTNKKIGGDKVAEVKIPDEVLDNLA